MLNYIKYYGGLMRRLEKASSLKPNISQILLSKLMHQRKVLENIEKIIPELSVLHNDFRFKTVISELKQAQAELSLIDFRIVNRMKILITKEHKSLNKPKTLK